MDFKRVQLIVTVPTTHLYAVLDALHAAGAGAMGAYSCVAFLSFGTGRFLPGADAHPTIGAPGSITEVPEMRIETFCERGEAKRIIAVIREAHPYEEPAIFMLPLIYEEDL